MRKLLIALFLVSVAWSQEPGQDPLGDHFIPPELIMQNQKALGITDTQREQIKKQVSAAQVKFTELQWDLQAEVEKLSRLLADLEVEEQTALGQLDTVLSTEAQIKRAQLTMLIRLRQVLTNEQLAKANELKAGSFLSERHLEQLKRHMEAVRRQVARIQRELQEKFGSLTEEESPQPDEP
jgi:Spy/CpxP family protein refolding chaperone